jgi:spore germination protein KA
MFGLFRKNKDKSKKDFFAKNTLPYQADAVMDRTFSSNLNQNVKDIKNGLSNSDDVTTRELSFNQKQGYLIYFSSLVSEESIEKNIIVPINRYKEGNLKQTVTSSAVKEVTTLKEVVGFLIKGQCAFLLQGSTSVFVMNAKGDSKRSLEEPINEQVLRGAHIGFIEDLNSNLQILRNRAENPHLKVEYLVVGKTTKTKVALVYFEHLANDTILEKLKGRIEAISADFIQTPGFIEEYIEDRPFSPFPQMLNTERPDRTVANLIDGRIGILMEGSPTCLIAPSQFISFFQSPDDYNGRMFIGSFYRLIRVLGFFIAVGLPALYTAVVSFHYEIIPVELLFTVKSSLEPIPIPPLLEAMVMQLTLELIREAAVRLPQPIAQTIGVVGGLVIGNAVVDANLVSNMMIIVVALTAVASFIVPSNEMATSIRLLGFPLMLLAATFGLVGIILGFSIILMHLCKLESFGSPYFSPFGPLQFKDLKDTIVRFPVWLLGKRPSGAEPKYITRESNQSREWDENNE